MYRSLNPTKHWESSTPSAAARTFRPPPADAARQAYVDVDEEDSEDDVRLAEPSGYGGIFNLEFSPDGCVAHLFSYFIASNCYIFQVK